MVLRSHHTAGGPVRILRSDQGAAGASPTGPDGAGHCVDVPAGGQVLQEHGPALAVA
jgi:hypothetical protein